MSAFDWHAGKLTRETPVTKDYRTTQNVRRFLADELARRRPGKMGGPGG